VIQAVEIVGAGGVAKVFRPTGVTGEWELELQTARGPEPGGHWSSEDVARAVVDDIYEGGRRG
jgi:hypothetical protein